MKNVFNMGLKVFGKMIVVVLICNFICLSAQMVSTSLFCETIGYSIYGYEGDNEEDLHFLYEYYYEDGEDTKLAEYNNSDYTLQRRSIRSEMSTIGRTVFLLVSQVLCFIILVSFLYQPLWKLGFKDSNSVRFGRSKEDKFKGLKIGLVASLPAIAFYIVFILCGAFWAPDMPTVLYTWLNCHLFSFTTLIFSSYPTAGTLGILQYALLFLLLFVLPLFSQGCYMLGYKNIDIGEKAVYKENKE